LRTKEGIYKPDFVQLKLQLKGVGKGQSEKEQSAPEIDPDT